MLVISRKLEESIKLGENIEIRILDIYSNDTSGKRSSKVASLGIEAPREISILRKELVETVAANKAAQQSALKFSGASLAGLLKVRRKLEEED